MMTTHAWTVRDVVAHLALAQLGVGTAVREVLRAGTRRRAPLVTPMEPLIDALVHTQDMARPLAIDVPMPREAAVAAAQRVWTMGFPFWAARRLRGTRLVALDLDWSVASGRAERTVEAPIADLLLLLTGRGGVTP